MKKNMKVIRGILAVLLVSVIMTACNSVKGLSENTQLQESKQQDGSKDKAEIHTPDPDAPPESEEKSILPNQISKLGEEVSEIDVDNGKVIPEALVYTVKKATIFTDIEEAGISEEETTLTDALDESYLDEDGKIKPSVKFLVVEMTVKNIRALPDKNITSITLLYADSIKETADKTSEIDFFDLTLPAYFSHPSGARIGEDWVQYYDYSLPVGESKDLKVGWYIDIEQYNPSNLYLVFNRYNDELERYVKLLE